MKRSLPIAHVSHHLKRAWLVVRRDASEYYTILAEREIQTLAREKTAPAQPMWLNLGYWEHATTFPEAAAALAQRLGEEAALGPCDRVLDVGFGYAEPAAYWVRTFGIAELVGVNVTPLHATIAQRLVKHRRVSDRIRLYLASATNLPFTGGCFDKVLALECAFHFDTRERFFAEAHRVLRSGGRIAIADMLPQPGRKWSGLSRYLRRRQIAIPEANMYDRVTYAAKLQAAGFANIRVESIARHVYAPFARLLTLWRERRTDIHSIAVRLDEEELDRADGASLWDAYGISDYVLVTADKP